MKYQLSDELMKELVQAEYDISLSEYEEVTPPPLSSHFYRRMRPYLYKKKRRISVFAAVLIAVFMLGATTVMAYEPFRTAVFQFFENIFSDRTTISFQFEDSLTLEGEFQEYEIKLPDRFQLEGDYVWEEAYQAGYIFVNEKTDEIINFDYGTVDGTTMTLTTDEDYEPRMIVVDGNEIRVYYDGDFTTLVWYSGEYCFLLSGNLSEGGLVSYMGFIQKK